MKKVGFSLKKLGAILLGLVLLFLLFKMFSSGSREGFGEPFQNYSICGICNQRKVNKTCSYTTNGKTFTYTCKSGQPAAGPTGYAWVGG
jgi:hypothetical protein